MRPFRYRTPRFLASAQLYFQVGRDTVPGVCTDVSLGGLRAVFEEGAPQVGTAGALLLRYPQRQFTLGAVVSHLEGSEVGFSFVQRTEEELLAAEQFAAFLDVQPAESLVPRPA